MATQNEELYDQLPAELLRVINGTVKQLETEQNPIDRGEGVSTLYMLECRLCVAANRLDWLLDQDVPYQHRHKYIMTLIAQAVRFYLELPEDDTPGGYEELLEADREHRIARS